MRLSNMPWQAKVTAKLLLSRIPLRSSVRQKLGMFRHGRMTDLDYASKIFKRHFSHASFPRKHSAFVALELGPGDSLLSALIAKSFGASMTYLIDTGDYAVSDGRFYQDMLKKVAVEGFSDVTRRQITDRRSFLCACDATYLTRGVESFSEIPDASVDFIFSQAVLEHVRHAEFEEFIRQMRRVLRSDGVCSHRIDLRDHLGGALNNLRFSSRVWESKFMAKSGFYTNRFSYSEMLEIFRCNGFNVDVVGVDRWTRIPTPRSKLAREFRTRPDSELLVSGFDVILRPQ